MENLDDLSNEELRLRLLEYGLSNIPVTQTTRKVLVRKLKNHIEGAKTNVRRETIHVTKYSSDEEVAPEAVPEVKTKKKEVVNRRATIGGDKLSKEIPSVPVLPPTQTKQDAKTRRSGRITPVLENTKVTIAKPSIEPIIDEDSEEDIRTPISRKDRKSQTPPLSKGDTVTTSYVHHVDIEQEPPIVEEMDFEENEDDDVMLVEEVVEQVRLPRREFKSRFSTTEGGAMKKRSTIEPSLPSTTSKYADKLSSLRTENFSDSFGRPSLSTSFNYTPGLKKEFKKDVGNITIDPHESPYLSEFTRRLSRLKVDPLPETNTRRTTHAAYRTAEQYRPTVSSPLMQNKPTNYVDNKNDIRESLRAVIVALDQKYPIKKGFYLVLILLIVIFVFVFFFV